MVAIDRDFLWFCNNFAEMSGGGAIHICSLQPFGIASARILRCRPVGSLLMV